MDIRLSPPREGVRGGREQFKWDDVKNYATKEREHYLGHSVKIGMLKHKNKFYKHDWYMKGTGDREGDPSEELSLIKMYEDELMQEMLGAKPKRLMLLPSRPTDVESLRKLLCAEGTSATHGTYLSDTNETTKDKLDTNTTSRDAYRSRSHRGSNKHRRSSKERHKHRRRRERSQRDHSHEPSERRRRRRSYS